MALTRKTAEAGPRLPKPIGELIPEVLEQGAVFGGLRRQQVVEAWEQAVGREAARCARPVRLRGSTLLVEVDSAAQLQELRNFTGEAKRRALNERLGSPLVARIVFRFGAQSHGG